MAIDSPTTESKAQFARRLGVARSTITRAAAQGRLVLDDQGRVLVEPSLERWHATTGHRTDLQAQHAAERGNAIPQASGAAAGQGAHTATEEPDETDIALNESRAGYQATALRYTNALARLERDLAAHRRYPLDDVTQAAYGLGARTRAALEHLIDELAPRLAGAADRATRAHLIHAEVRRLAAALQRDHARAQRRLRASTGETA